MAADRESDGALVQRVLSGQRQAFRALVEKYQDAVFGVALSRTGSFADAEEIAQEAFLAAFDRLGSLKAPASFGNWLCGIARNKARAHLRAARTRRLAHDRLAEAARSREPAGRDDGRERRACVRDALGRLSDANREVATLYYIDGYSVADVGRFVRRPAGTVKRRLHEARRHLRKELLTMMEGELKRSRPGRKFTDAVVRRITGVRVWLSGREHNYLLLCDSQGRCSERFIGQYEAKAIQASLASRRGPRGINIDSALFAMLEAFGYRASQVRLDKSPRLPNYLVRLKLARARQKLKTVKVEYAGRDAVQLAVHSRTEFFLDRWVAKKWMIIKGKDGKPMSPAAAWRTLRRRNPPHFRNFDEVLRALEKNPKSERARRCLGEAVPKFSTDLPHVQDTRGGWDKVMKWVSKCKGTELEATAVGLLGALYLHRSLDEPAKAARCLEKAHKLRPEDEDIAFDLATAYVGVSRTKEALELLGQFKFKDAVLCNNFEKLWKDPRFRQFVDAPKQTDPSAHVHFVRQTYLHSISAKGEPKKWLPEHTVKVARADRALRVDLQRLFDGQGLTGVDRFTCVSGKGSKKRWGLLRLGAKAVAAVTVPDWLDRRRRELNESLVKTPAYPWRSPVEGALTVLSRCGIGMEAVVLRKAEGRELLADLIGRKGRRRERVPINGIDALSLAVRARCPILMTESLAEKLTVRGRSGRPLTIAGAKRKLLSG